MDKKEILKHLEEHFGVKPKYLGAPSFAHQIVTGQDVYTIDRHGVVITAEGREVALEELIEGGPPGAKGDVGITATEGDILSDGFEAVFPLEGHTGSSLQNLVNILSSKQSLIAKVFGLKEPFMDATFAEDLSQKATGTLEEFRKSFHDLGQERCPGLTFDFEKGILTFRLAGNGLNQDEIKAFTELASLINKNARELKRASFKLSQEENPKYAFRTWLIRLGMNGAEFKATRKVLLANLEGSGAYRKAGGNG